MVGNVENNRLEVDLIRGAWLAEKHPTIAHEVQAFFYKTRRAFSPEETSLLLTYGHMDGNELSAFVEALLQQTDSVTDDGSLARLQHLAEGARDTALLLASAQIVEDHRLMYEIVSREFDRTAEHFAQRLGGRGTPQKDVLPEAQQQPQEQSPTVEPIADGAV